MEEAISSLFIGIVEHILLTMGAEGAVWYTKTDRVSVAGHHVQAIDTTGAGDSFIGALLFQVK